MRPYNPYCRCAACAAMAAFLGVAVVIHSNDHHEPMGPVPGKAHIEVPTATSTTSSLSAIVTLSTSTR